MEPHIVAVALVVVIMGFFFLDSILGTGAPTTTLTLRTNESQNALGVTLTLVQVGIQGPGPQGMGTIQSNGAVITVTRGSEISTIAAKVGETKTFGMGTKSYSLSVLNVNLSTNEVQVRLIQK